MGAGLQHHYESNRHHPEQSRHDRDPDVTLSSTPRFHGAAGSHPAHARDLPGGLARRAPIRGGVLPNNQRSGDGQCPADDRRAVCGTPGDGVRRCIVFL